MQWFTAQPLAATKQERRTPPPCHRRAAPARSASRASAGQEGPRTHRYRLSVKGRVIVTALISVRNIMTEVLTKSDASKSHSENSPQAAANWRVSRAELALYSANHCVPAPLR